MTLDPSAIGAAGPAVESAWTSGDALLYALGVGAGALDTAFELEFTTENATDHPQRVLPTFATVIDRPREADGATLLGPPLSDAGTFDLAVVFHGEQAIELLGPLPPDGRIRTVTRIADMYDKGSGAIVVLESESVSVESGAALFRNRASVFIRGEGGFGGSRGPATADQAPPDRDPDHLVTYTTRPDQNLLYRLSGDRNPLHCDPVAAKRAGFERPILHGLCTYGFTGRALLHTLCDSDPDRFGSMSARFTKPVYPGDSLTVSIWTDEAGGARFRTTTQTGDVVLDHGRFALR